MANKKMYSAKATTGNKKSSDSGKNTGTKKYKSQKTKTELERKARAEKKMMRAKDPTYIGNQLTVVLMIALAFLLLLFMIAGANGIEDSPLIGFCCKIVYGFFGYSAIFIIFILTYSALTWKNDVKRGSRAYKLITGFLFLTTIAVFIHTISVAVGNVEVTASVKTLWGDGNLLDSGVYGGGLIGGLLAFVLEKLIAYNWVIIIISLIFVIAAALAYFRITPYKIYLFVKALITERDYEKEYEKKLEKESLAEEKKLEKERKRLELEEAKEAKEAEKEKARQAKEAENIRKEEKAKEVLTAKEAEIKKPEERSGVDMLFAKDEEEEDEPDYEDVNVEEIFKNEKPSVKKEPAKVKEPVQEEPETEEDEPEEEPEAVAGLPIEEDDYEVPPIDLLKKVNTSGAGATEGETNEVSAILEETLKNFKVEAKVVSISRGPTITRYELTPAVGVRVRQIANLVDDISLALGSEGIRIEAPVPGKTVVGIEVPNRSVSTVYLRDIIESEKFQSAKGRLITAVGKDVGGSPVIFDLAKMPHLLIAGATGQGKSVALNCIIVSLFFKYSPKDLKLILIDPKKVEMQPYKNIPHLLMPVVTSAKKAAGALSTAVTEMERRFELIESAGVRDIKSYNAAIANDPSKEYLPSIVIIIDELNDLMQAAKETVETSICRIAQKARAAGIHLIVCTQRPSVDVITGVIKANIPSRMALTVTSIVDSRTILDMAGAEKLIGRGDMLFAPVGAMKPIRAQGAFLEDEEIEAVTDFLRSKSETVKYNDSFIKMVDETAEKMDNSPASTSGSSDSGDSSESDPKLWEACDIAYEMGKISTSLLQRKLAIGYGRAAKIIDSMESLGIVGPQEGQKPRTIVMPREDYLSMRMNTDSVKTQDSSDGSDLE